LHFKKFVDKKKGGGKVKLIYAGKTKDVYELKKNHLLLIFKDDATGTNGQFDPGSNKVGLEIKGSGRAALEMSKMFFELLHKKRIPNHYVAEDIKERQMLVKNAKLFGQGLEVICRFRAVGSFFRRYGNYVEKNQILDPPLVEFTLKDDEREDPLINKEALELLGILSKKEYKLLTKAAIKISNIIKEELARKNLELYDIKLEFGKIDEQIVLIDEISGGNMRVYKDNELVPPLELTKILLSKED
jgi:phosphoribosylaminoimidazole-succinocarboxamide synthase